MGVLAVGRYVSEAWFGRRLARRPPGYLLATDEPVPYQGRPERPRPARPELTRPAGMALIITGTVLLLAVSIQLPFLNVKLLGLILIVIGLVKVRALQRASRWLWQNRHDVMTALDAPPDETPAPRVPLDTLLVPTAAVSRRDRRRERRQAARSQDKRRPRPRLGRLGQRRGSRQPEADQLAGAAGAR